jgi:hypothetical protein
MSARARNHCGRSRGALQRPTAQRRRAQAYARPRKRGVSNSKRQNRDSSWFSNIPRIAISGIAQHTFLAERRWAFCNYHALTRASRTPYYKRGPEWISQSQNNKEIPRRPFGSERATGVARLKGDVLCDGFYLSHRARGNCP